MLEVTQQRHRRLRMLGVAKVVGHANAQRDSGDSRLVEPRLQDTHQPSDALVLRP